MADRIHPEDLKARAKHNPEAFMAGVALFDEILREASRLARADEAEAAGIWIEACIRYGAPLNMYALKGLRRLAKSPELVPGFAAALGDYVGSNNQGQAPSEGAQFERLTFDAVWLDQSEPPPPQSNVVRERERDSEAEAAEARGFARGMATMPPWRAADGAHTPPGRASHLRVVRSAAP